MTQPTPAAETAAGDLLPGADDTLRAAGLPFTIVPPEELAGDGQMPYEKTDRVPEVAIPLERAVLDFLDDQQPRDEGPWTPGMLRMMRARSEVKADEPSWTVGLFQVLASEGGPVVGEIVADSWWGPGRSSVTSCGPLLDLHGEASEQLAAAVEGYERGDTPYGTE